MEPIKQSTCLKLIKTFLGKIGNTHDVAARKACSYVVSRCFIGDWFVLYQLSKNCNMYFFRTFIKELRRDMKKNPKRHIHSLSQPPVFDANHILKGQQPITQSEIDEADDKFDPEEGNDGNDTDLYVDLPEEKTSLLTDEEDAHNAPTLRRQSKVDDDVEEITASKPGGPPRLLGKGRIGRKIPGKIGRGAGAKKAVPRRMGRGGGGGRMAGMASMDPDMAMMMM